MARSGSHASLFYQPVHIRESQNNIIIHRPKAVGSLVLAEDAVRVFIRSGGKEYIGATIMKTAPMAVAENGGDVENDRRGGVTKTTRGKKIFNMQERRLQGMMQGKRNSSLRRRGGDAG
jgi:hypothetical protein